MAAADTPCGGVRTEGVHDHDVLATVARIGGRLATASEGGGGEAAVAVESSLRELQGVHMTFEALEATKIGRAVNALRKTAPSEQARRSADALYRGWKALADERFRSGRAQQPPPPKADVGVKKQQTPQPKADEGVKKRSSSISPPPPAVDAKQSAGPPEGEREMAPTSVVVEATPQTNKLHLRDGCDSAAATVRKPMSKRVVNTNAPGKPEQRRVTVVVRSTAATPEPEPAPASNTTRKNGGRSKSNQQATDCPATASKQGTNAAAKRRVSPPGAAAAPLTTSANAKPPPTALPKKPIGSLDACRKRKAEATAVFDEARLARARARLHDGYKEASAVKEKRKIKEINAIDALVKKKKARQLPAQLKLVRCTAAHRTGKQAPAVPCPPRMPKAF